MCSSDLFWTFALRMFHTEAHMQTSLIVIDHPKQNRILAALPVEEYARLLDDLELIALELGHVLYEPGDSLKYIYFPTTCIVSLVFTTKRRLGRTRHRRQ